MANRPASGVEHVLVALPSYSVGESLLSHYADRIASLEHRYLVSQLMLQRIKDCHLVFITSRAPERDVLDYYASLLGEGGADLVRRRFQVLEVPDPSARSVAAKLLDRPHLLTALEALIAGRRALIEPWNVTQAEVEILTCLEVPINGTSPDLWKLGFKSEGRRIFRDAGVSVPVGVEDVRSASEVLCAIGTIRAARPNLTRFVVKLDDSGAGRQRRARPGRRGRRREARGAAGLVRPRPGNGRGRRAAHHGCRLREPERTDRHPSRRRGSRPRHPRAGARWTRRPGLPGLPVPRGSGVRPDSRTSRRRHGGGARRARSGRPSLGRLCRGARRELGVGRPRAGGEPAQRRDHAPVHRAAEPGARTVRRRYRALDRS